MKKLLVITLSISLFSCKSKKEDTSSSSTSNSTATTVAATQLSNTVTNAANASTATSTNTDATKLSTAKDVSYYYQKLANVDSEDPSIGVGPRTIISVDKKTGILRYKENGATEEKTIQVWNKAGYDVIDFPGGVFVSINGAEPKWVENIEAANAIVKQEGDKRTARGGECEYADNAMYYVNDKGEIEIRLHCNDAKFWSTVGYVKIENRKLVAKKAN